jgi:hypothetical protein
MTYHCGLFGAETDEKISMVRMIHLDSCKVNRTRICPLEGTKLVFYVASVSPVNGPSIMTYHCGFFGAETDEKIPILLNGRLVALT